MRFAELEVVVGERVGLGACLYHQIHHRFADLLGIVRVGFGVVEAGLNIFKLICDSGV